jgi:Trp operon repressor
MKNTNKHIQRAQYMLKNNLTIAETAALLNLDATTVRKSIKAAGESWKKKIDAMLAWKKINFNVDNSESIHIQRMRYILGTKSIKSYVDAAKKLKLSAHQVEYSAKQTEKNNKVLYNKVKEALAERNATRSKVIKCVLNNPKMTRKEIKKKFNISNSVISTALAEVRASSMDSYNLVKQTLDNNKNPLYKQYANYIVKNKVDIVGAAKYFGKSIKNITDGIRVLKLYDPKLYDEVKQVLTNTK